MDSVNLNPATITKYLTLIHMLAHLLLFAGIETYTQPRYLIGVHPDRLGFYQLAGERKFNCLDGSRVVPFDAVNDDYCDCRDGSDEPGTSACSNGQFFCRNEGYISKIIPSGWVNDGQCDCCDSSDEYNSTAKCELTCQSLGELYRQEQEMKRQISEQGSTIRSQYKQQAKQLREQNSQLLDQYRREVSEKEASIKKLEEEMNSDYGPANVFLPLKGKCFTFNEREYVYTLCPFERAAQESTSGMQTELGRWAGWVGPADNLYSMQKYEGGAQCWNGPARSALIRITCGVEDKVELVTEPAKCEYVYDFITPAACPDLDPPEVDPEQNLHQVSTVNPELEVEDESTEEPTGHFSDEHNEAPDDDGLPSDLEKHDEL